MSSAFQENFWPATAKTGLNSGSPTKKPSNLAKRHILFISLLSLFPRVESTKPHSSHLAHTYLPLPSSKTFLSKNGLRCFLPTFPGVVNTLSNSPGLVKIFREPISDISSTQSVRLSTLFCKPALTEIFPLDTTLSHQKSSRISGKSSRP